MTDLYPFENWLHIYNPETDEMSPFFEVERNEVEYTMRIYNYFISPYWDDIGSSTLYIKELFVDYEESVAIIEMVGEWNDAIENDIMNFKRQLIDSLISQGIYKFILIGENVLNFHSSDLSYYEEWQSDLEGEAGFIVCLNFPDHTRREMESEGLGAFMFFMDYDKWRTHEPLPFYQMIEEKIFKLLL